MFRLLLTVVLGAGLVACGGEDKKETASAQAAAPAAINLPSSSIVVAGIREVRPSFEYPAVVEAVQLARIRPEISAVVKAIHVSAGLMVQKGDLLLEFDDATYVSANDIAEANLQSAEASFIQAMSNWDRAEDLMPQGYISQQDYDKARAGIDSARAAVASAKAQIAQTKLNLARTKIYAPFTGKISKPYYSIGDAVVPNSPNSPQPLFTLVEMDPIYVTAGVQLAQYHKFVLLRKELETRGIDVPPLAVSLMLSGGVEYPQKGAFEAWDNTSTASSGTVSGRVLFPNPDGLLLPGNSVTISGEALRSFKRVLIPQKAVMQDQEGYFVKVVDDNSTVSRRNLTLGIRYKDEWIVLEGLEEGAKVIAVGAQMLREGAAVSLL